MYPEITTPCNAENINWANLGYGRKYRAFMSIVNWVIAMILIAASITLIILLKRETTSLKSKYNTNIVCPKDSTSDRFKELAW